MHFGSCYCDKTFALKPTKSEQYLSEGKESQSLQKYTFETPTYMYQLRKKSPRKLPAILYHCTLQVTISVIKYIKLKSISSGERSISQNS